MNNTIYKSAKFKKISALLESGKSPSDLMDDRLYNPPFESIEIFETLRILDKINRGIIKK